MPHKDPEKRREYFRRYHREHSGAIRARAKRYYEQHKEQISEKHKSTYSPEKKKDSHLRRLYDISMVEYEAMLKNQGGNCAICHGQGRRRLAVDHCHRTNRVRGLLCSNCNFVLGYAEDTVALLEKSVRYLLKWKK